MTAEPHTLNGVYALDAVAPPERALFRRHLGECAACRDEVRELRETAARLAAAEVVTPSPELRSAVFAEIRRTRQRPPRGWRRSPWPERAALFGAAAAAVVAVVIGLQGTGNPPPDVPVATSDVVVSHEGGKALVTANLPGLDSRHVYQVWLLGKGNPRSAGLLPRGAHTLATDLPPGVDRIGITVEPVGGSNLPTTSPVAVAAVT